MAEELDKLWCHLPTRILPEDWSCNWLEFQRLPRFLPLTIYPTSYSVGTLDIELSSLWGLSYPIKGVMYNTMQWLDPDDPLMDHSSPPRYDHPLHERMVIQDALGDYYYHYEFSQGGGEFAAKFRAPRGTHPEDFVKNYFKGGVRGVDMDEVPTKWGKRVGIIDTKQRQLGNHWGRVQAESRCACVLRLHSGYQAK